MATPKEVAEFHKNSDLNKSAEAQHHTIGLGLYEAASGGHIHDGRTGRPLLDGVIFTGSRSNATASVLNQVLEALKAVGAINNTTT